MESHDNEIVTARLVLTPLRVDDADAMVEVLEDPRLHEFVGGRPASLDELRAQYRRFVAGSPDPNERWLNWIVRLGVDARPVGTVQATITLDANGNASTAHVAWVIGGPWQRRGYGSEAARALVEWLRRHDTTVVLAHVHPEHRASAAVATRAGLRPTPEAVDGEEVWVS
jgi:RimJ/RimL family protein N-acetyltransferase